MKTMTHRQHGRPRVYGAEKYRDPDAPKSFEEKWPDMFPDDEE